MVKSHWIKFICIILLFLTEAHSLNIFCSILAFFLFSLAELFAHGGGKYKKARFSRGMALYSPSLPAVSFIRAMIYGHIFGMVRLFPRFRPPPRVYNFSLPQTQIKKSFSYGFFFFFFSGSSYEGGVFP